MLSKTFKMSRTKSNQNAKFIKSNKKRNLIEVEFIRLRIEKHSISVSEFAVRRSFSKGILACSILCSDIWDLHLLLGGISHC